MNYWNLEIVTEPRKRRRIRVTGKDKVLLEIFERVAGEDGVVDAFELRDLLQNCFRQQLGEYKFNLETCRSMILLHDDDKSGCLEFDEFLRLWQEMKTWYSVFKKHDTDRSNDMNAKELARALAEVDLKLSRKTSEIFLRRFANRNGNINLDDFFQIIARTLCLTRSFERQLLRSGDIGRNPKARFGLEAYIEANIVS